MCMQARACACWRRRIVDRERHVTATSSTTCSLCSSTTCLELMVCSLYTHTCLLTYLLTTSGHVLSTPAGKLTSITEMEMSNVITAGCLALWCQHYNDRKSTPRPAVPWITQSKMEKNNDLCPHGVSCRSGVCLPLSVANRNGWRDRAGFDMKACFDLPYTTF